MFNIGHDLGMISAFRLIVLVFNAGKRKMRPPDSGNLYPQLTVDFYYYYHLEGTYRIVHHFVGVS